VIREKRTLLLGSDKVRDEFITEWRQNCVNKVCELFEQVTDAERAFFGLKSYFYLKDLGEEDRAFSSDDDADRASPTSEGIVHGFKNEEEIDSEMSIDEEE